MIIISNSIFTQLSLTFLRIIAPLPIYKQHAGSDWNFITTFILDTFLYEERADNGIASENIVIHGSELFGVEILRKSRPRSIFSICFNLFLLQGF